MWIDAHCHLSDPRVQDIAATLAFCEQAGITRFVLGGVDPTDWDRQAELTIKYPGRFVQVFGLHPWWIHDHGDDDIAPALQALEARLDQASALGETGLDNARDRFKTSKARQTQAFEAQLELAKERHKPLVLHIVRAHAQAIEILRTQAPRAGGLIHSFSGTWADAEKYLDLGFTLSISARVTHPNAHDLRETVQKAPLGRLVYETDAPDQAPFGADGKLHTPLSLLKVVREVSEIRRQTGAIESPEQLLDHSRDVLQRILRF